MGKSSGSSGMQSSVSAKSPLQQLARDPRALRRVHAAMHRFVEQLEAEIDVAVDAARARQLAAIRRIKQTGQYLHFRYLLADQATGACPRKPKGLTIEPDVIIALKAVDAMQLAGCLDRLHDAIAALEPYDGVPFNRKPIGFRKAGGKTDVRNSGSATAGPEETALAALELAGQDLIGLFRGLGERLAANCMTKAARRKPPKGEPLGMLTPPQVAERLGVSPDKILNWIRKGELNAVNVAAVGAGRPRYRISEEDLTKFQQARQNVKPPPKSPRWRKKDPNVTEYFKYCGCRRPCERGENAGF